MWVCFEPGRDQAAMDPDLSAAKCSVNCQSARFKRTSSVTEWMARVRVWRPVAERPAKPPFIRFSWVRLNTRQRLLSRSSGRRACRMASGVTGLSSFQSSP